MIYLENRYRKRKRTVSKNKSEIKENECRINRTHQDFLNYKIANNIKYYVEMDTVEGIKGHLALLTLNFIPFNFMIACKLESQTISGVADRINELK